MRTFALVFGLLLILHAPAGDLTTTTGKVYKDVVLSDAKPDGIIIVCKGKPVWIPLEQLPECPARQLCIKAKAAQEKQAALAKLAERNANATKSIVSVIKLDVFKPDKYSRSDRILYSLRLKNEGGKDWRQKVTLTLVNGKGEIAETEEKDLLIKAHGENSVLVGSTFPLAAYDKEKGIVSWKLEIGEELMASGDAPEKY